MGPEVVFPREAAKHSSPLHNGHNTFQQQRAAGLARGPGHGGPFSHQGLKYLAGSSRPFPFLSTSLLLSLCLTSEKLRMGFETRHPWRRCPHAAREPRLRALASEERLS